LKWKIARLKKDNSEMKNLVSTFQSEIITLKSQSQNLNKWFQEYSWKHENEDDYKEEEWILQSHSKNVPKVERKQWELLEMSINKLEECEDDIWNLHYEKDL
jgi:hypothetical protein